MHKKKRYWLLFILIGWLIFSRMDATNFRYNPELLEKEIATFTNRITTFRTIPFGKTAISYIKVGDRDALPLIVFVHGSPGSLTAAKNYLLDEKLYSRADMISVDRLGFGHSDYGIAETSLQRHADMLFEILKPYMDRRIVLVGHSMGGPVLTKYAMEYRARLEAMVMVAPSISPVYEPSNTWRQLLNCIPIRWLTPPALRVCNQEIIPLKQELSAMENEWNSINIPVTIIHGTSDLLVPVENADFASKKLVNSPSGQYYKNGKWRPLHLLECT